MRPASIFFRLCRQRYPHSQSGRIATLRPTQNSRQLSGVQDSAVSAEDATIETRPYTEDQRRNASAQIQHTAASPSGSEPVPISTNSSTNVSSSISHAGASEEAPAPVLANPKAAAHRNVKMVGTVTRTGTMKQTVAVSRNLQHFDNFLKKHYTKAVTTLVHDPTDTLIEGDVIAYSPFPQDQMAERTQKGKKRNVRFVVQDVITPFGPPIDQRIPRVTNANPARLATKYGLSPKQRRAAGVRGYATMVERRIDGSGFEAEAAEAEISFRANSSSVTQDSTGKNAKPWGLAADKSLTM